MNIIRIDARHLRAAIHCAGKKDVRYYLNGVRIEALPTETRVIATDGYKVAVFRSPFCDHVPASVTIPRDVVERLVKEAKRTKIVELRIDGESHSLGFSGDSIAFSPIDGRFPDYRQIFSHAPSGETAQFDPEHLAAFTKVAKALGTRQPPQVTHNGTGTAPVWINAITDFAGAVAPFKTPATRVDVPDTSWASR